MLRTRVVAACGRFALAAVFVLFLGSLPAQAQAVDAFNPGTLGTINALALQPDGKILVGGTFSTLGGGGNGTVPREKIARLLPDGNVDSTFNPGAEWTVRALALQPDGKILVGGAFTGLGGGTGTTARLSLGRLHPDGSVDAGFNPGAVVSGQNAIVYSIQVLQNGQILIGGMFTGIGGGTGDTTRRGIALLNADGTLDVTFNPGTSKGGAAGVVYTIAQQADGAILIGGDFTGVGGGTGTTSRLNIARIDLTGIVDPAFNPGVSHSVAALTVQADQRILVGGDFVGIGGGTGTTPRRMLARLEADGTVEAPFNPFPVQVANSGISSIALQADGRIVVGGPFVQLQPGFGNQGIGRLNADGTIDVTFVATAPGGFVNALAIQDDGRIIVGGGFESLTGTTGNVSRRNVGRFMNTAQPTESLTATGGSTVTWNRGGTAPEVDRVQFAISTDGIVFSELGIATRISGGWQLAGLCLPSDSNLRIRARGFHASGALMGSGSIDESTAPISGAETVENGAFTGGMIGWLTFALPGPSGMNYQVSGDVFEFNRSGTQAVVLQQTGMPVPASAPLLASFRLGNTDIARKRISVLLHDSDFTDLHVCTFWLPAGLPLTTYAISTHTTKAWSNLTISFYAATVGSGGFYRLDDVSVTYNPPGTSDATTCTDPLAPATTTDPSDADVIVNGGFSGGLPPWTTFGQINSQISGGVFEFIKLAGTPAGVVLQATGQSIAANEILTASLQLGNTSGVRKRVTVIIHDLDFSDLSACTFWLSPGQPLSTYTYRTFTTEAWTNATLAVYPATVGSEQWMQLDNVSLQRTPAGVTTGTLCVEPGGAVPGPIGHPRGSMAMPATVHGSEDTDLSSSRNQYDYTAFESDSIGVGSGLRVAELADQIDLAVASSATLTFRSWLNAGNTRGFVQVSTDRTGWEVISVVGPSDTWMPVEIDLAAYLGERLSVRFVFDAGNNAPNVDSWRIEEVAVGLKD